MDKYTKEFEEMITPLVGLYPEQERLLRAVYKLGRAHQECLFDEQFSAVYWATRSNKDPQDLTP